MFALAPAAPVAPIAVSTRTHRGFKKPGRRRPAAPVSLPLLAVDGAEWAFSDSRTLVASVVPAAPVAPVLVLVPSLPAEIPAPVAPAPVVVDEPAPAPVAVPAGAASVRVAPVASAFRVVVVDLETDELSSVSLRAGSAAAARRECSDDDFLPVAVFAVLPSGDELVWGEAA